MLTKENLKTDTYNVSQFINEAEFLLAQRFSTLKITGEISNLSCPSSGHVYFSLKDDRSQVRCAFFKGQHRRLDFQLKEGMQILAKASPAIYAARGDFQLIVEQIERSGEGALRQAFEQLKAHLAKEGLFDSQYKKPLPALPKTIGIITSSTGAAIRDVLTVLKRRFPAIPVIIYPVLVQGKQASPQIIAMIKKANKDRQADVLMLTRGGGSLEDLWAFNEEALARAMFESELPIITGIGHEVDFTIADFVSDVRAPTPSAAAELIVPDKAEFQRAIDRSLQCLIQIVQAQWNQLNTYLAHLSKRLQHPQTQLDQKFERLALLEKRLRLSTQTQLNANEQKLSALKQQLHIISPLNTLERGYAIAMHKQNVLTDPKQVNAGDKLTLKLAKGNLDCVAL